MFLELCLIRWISANVRLIGYFTNLLLIASFLGIGLGFLKSHKKIDLLFLFPYLLLVLMVFVYFIKIQVNIVSEDALFFSSSYEENVVEFEPEIILPLVFILVALIFATLAQFLGRNFSEVKPLKAYSIDILGSLLGIIVFSAISFFWVQPYVWFSIICVIFLFLNRNNFQKGLIFLPIIGILVINFIGLNNKTIWSPYYKITINEFDDPYSGQPGYALNVNNIAHQFISYYSSRAPFYYAPYKSFKKTGYKKILIIGAGGGTDVATALNLNPGLEKIDAVEIDPVIYKFGLDLNPDKPFSDPRVKAHINDGRDFIQNSNEKYDLIIYALPDSLTLTSNASNIRLESFLFTKEAFESARDHLSDDGLFAVYNFYRENWLIEKIAGILEEVFGKTPLVLSYGTSGKAAEFLTGPKLDLPDILRENIPPFVITQRLERTSDDWPFLYLKTKSIPFFYLKFISILLIISLFLIWIFQRGQKGFKLDLKFFLLGAGFLLLETKSLVTFGLLFGNTWVVNSLVIGGILISILAANIISLKYKIKNLRILFFLLIITLVLNYIVPQSIFLQFNVFLRLILASIFYFSPIFFANLIFSQIFKEVEDSTLSFGSNLLGAVLGGFLEYSSLIFGYQNLTILIAAFYSAAFIVLYLNLKSRH